MKFSELDLLKVGNTIQLTGAIFSGEGKDLLLYFPDEKDVWNEIEELDLNHEDWKKFLKQTDVMEIEILQREETGGIVKAIYRKSQRQIDARVQWKVFKRDGYKCRYCGNDDVPLTVDHIILWEELGATVEENLLSACKKCNKTRGNTEYVKWLDSDFYERVSKNLTEQEKEANEKIVNLLDSLPRTQNTRSR